MSSSFPQVRARRAGIRSIRSVRRSGVYASGLLLAVPLHGIAQTTGAQVLSPIVVSATRFPEQADRLSLGVTVITAEQIRASGATTVNEAVIKLAGVPGRLDLYGGGDYALDLRGFGSTADNNQAVIVDGVRINENDLGGTRLAGIAIDSVDRIEIIRGNSAVLYGEGATGGAIVITTKAGRGETRKNSAQLYGAVGSHNLVDGRGTATINAGDVTLDAALNLRSTDNHRPNFDSTSEGAAVTAQWRGDGIRVGARHEEDQLESGLPGALTTPEYAANPHQSTDLTTRASIDNKRYSLFGDLALGDWLVGADVGWREKTLRVSSGYAYDIDAKTQSLRARNTMKWGTYTNALIFGIDHSEWGRNVLGSFGSSSWQRSLAFYAKDDFTFTSGTRVNVGLRTEKIDKQFVDSSTGTRIEARQRAWELGVLQPIGASTSVYGRVGRSFRLPNADEIGFFEVGSTLRPQTSRDIELGARWNDERTRVELRAYRSNLTDELAYDPTVPNIFGGIGANSNLDRTRRQGVELEVSRAVTSNANVRAIAARRQAKFTAGPDDGRDVPLVPHATVSLHADWTPVEHHTLDTVLRLVSSQHPDAANECSMPRYTTADLRYAFRRDGLELALGISNVTDRKYYTLAFQCIAGQTSAIYPEDGRAFTASVRLSF